MINVTANISLIILNTNSLNILVKGEIGRVDLKKCLNCILFTGNLLQIKQHKQSGIGWKKINLTNIHLKQEQLFSI